MATTADSTTAGDGSENGAAQHADVASLTYEQARDELVDIVARLENGQSGLEESMGLWQRGEVLAAHCATWLDRAEARISAGE
jgi:exodeoxyribonuclease VII small subunit